MSHHRNNQFKQWMERHTIETGETPENRLPNSQSREEKVPREQRLLRCGRSFYRIYVDDGKLVDH